MNDKIQRSIDTLSNTQSKLIDHKKQLEKRNSEMQAKESRIKMEEKEGN